MRTITLKNVPDDLLKKLKERARLNNRSLNGEVIFTLKKMYELNKLSPEEIIERARNIRNKVHVTLSDEEITEAKRRGRA